VVLFGVGANIVLARLLVPRDFGLVALGSVLLVFGNQLANGGVGAALIRREREPTRRELEAVSAAQLALTGVLVLAVAAVAAPLGRDGLVVAAMVATLPITVLRTPSVVVLERRLRYRAIATADIVEALAFYASSLTAVGLGMGVWGIAVGMYVRAISGTAVMARIGPCGLVRPRWSWAIVRPLAAFGVKFQALSAVAILREQGLNVGVAAVAGVATLGIWNLVWRILQVPFMLFGTVTRVAYPAISALLAAGEDPRPVIERGVATLAVATGLFLTLIGGFAPALPELVGPGWEDVPETLLWSSMALALGGPVAVVSLGYLTAADAIGTALRGGLAGAAAWFAVAIPLVTEIGAPGVGIGWIAGATLNTSIVARRTAAGTGARIVRNVAAPVLLTLAGIGAGWALAHEAGESVLAGLLGIAAGELVLIGGLAVVRRRLLRETSDLLRGALRSTAGGEPEAPAASART
jgi:O-antigen/teichoic acid export membrane protein